MHDKLLVIGNGFDLTISAKTSYSSFFESTIYEKTRDKVSSWIELCDNQGMPRVFFNIANFDFNCWDLLFYLESRESLNSKARINWCDVEKVIYEALTNSSHDSFSWEGVRALIKTGHWASDSACNSVKILSGFLFQQPEWRACCLERDIFYGKLLEELNKFERSFGVYIRRVTSNRDYSDKALSLVACLMGDCEGIHVDSFNYSDFSASRLWIRHINGDCSAPIFGINLSPEEEKKQPELCRFTKTSRRLYQDSENLNRHTQWGKLPIDQAVVFGHSLNQMDYDYFFHLFTSLRFHTFDLEKMGSVQFVYRNYDPARGNQIGDRYADSVYKLLSYYESGVSAYNNHMLINLLRFSGKLKISELGR